jgi:hypothetical protein
MRITVALALMTAAIANAAPQSSAAPPARAPQQRPAQPSPPVQLAPLDLTRIPEPCKPLAKQAMAQSLAAALSARVSLASCMADRAIAPLALCDCGESVLAIDTAVAPAIAVLDNAIEVGDPAMQVIAEHAEGKLYAGFAARLLTTLPKPGPGAADTELALRDLRKQTLEAQLAPWREAAMTAFQHVVEIARAHPEVASNASAASAIRDSQQQLAAESRSAERGA